MVFPFYVYVYILFWFLKPEGEGCTCSPSVRQDPQTSYRYDAKYETDFSKYSEHVGIISSETVRSWEKLYHNTAIKIFDKSSRMKNTPEDSIYLFKGYIYSAKINKHDCDLHLEIGIEDPAALRTVAEISKNNCKLQESIIQQLRSRDFVLGKKNQNGIKCVIKGLGFYDGKHPLKENKKYEQGSAWEIHPVLSIELE